MFSHLQDCIWLVKTKNNLSHFRPPSNKIYLSRQVGKRAVRDPFLSINAFGYIWCWDWMVRYLKSGRLSFLWLWMGQSWRLSIRDPTASSCPVLAGCKMLTLQQAAGKQQGKKGLREVQLSSSLCESDFKLKYLPWVIFGYKLCSDCAERHLKSEKIPLGFDTRSKFILNKGFQYLVFHSHF